MSNNAHNSSQWGMPSDTNPSEQIAGPSRRQSGVGRKESIGPSRSHDISGGADSPDLRIVQTLDPVNAKLDRILAGYSQLESRIEATDRRVQFLEPSHNPEPDPPYDPELEEIDPFPSHRQSQHRYSKSHFAGDSKQLPRTGNRYRHDRNLRQLNSQPRQFSDYPPRQFSDYPPRQLSAYPTERLRERSCWEPSNNRHEPSRSWETDCQRPATCWDPPSSRNNQEYSQSDYHPKVKINPPHFDGSDAQNWISRVQYYFDHIMMPEEHRLHYTVMLFDPPVDDWIFNYRANTQFVTWMDFLEDVRHRFDPQCYENYIGLISKLCQTGSVLDYQLAFEKMMNRISGVPESTLLPMYITGLKQPLQRQVKLHQPSSLAAAFALSHELSATQTDTAQTSSGFQKRTWHSRDSRSFNPTPTSAQDKISTTNPSGKERPSQSRQRDLSKLPVVRVSNAEKAERSKRGQCWYCNEKWAPGHVCQQTFLVYMGLDEDEELETDNEDEPVTADLSHLQSRDGRKRAKSLCINGSIGPLAVSVLIDTGASHDFLHPRVAEKLQLPLSPITPFRVYVGSGEYLLCSYVSKQTTLIMQNTSFVLDLHVLAAYGNDVILGMDWLESLGKVTHDYPERTMEFVKDGSSVVLQGVTPTPRRVPLCTLSALINGAPEHDLCELVAVDPPDSTVSVGQPLTLPADLPDIIQSALQRHLQVFEVPTGMPPRRPFDHRIHLLPSTRPTRISKKMRLSDKLEKCLDRVAGLLGQNIEDIL